MKPDATGDPGRAFLAASARHLVDEYIPKIRQCLDRLGPEDIWWRPNASSNSIGNLVLHLKGNATQWVLHGVLGEADVRDRDAEFATVEGEGPAGLVRALEGLRHDIAHAFERLDALCASDAGALFERRTIQGLDVSVLDAVYHVVEHFAQHTGQIIYVTKLRTGRDLEFWDVRDGVARPNW